MSNQSKPDHSTPEATPSSGIEQGLLVTDFQPLTIAPGVHVVPTQGNGLVVETAEGVIIVDAGPGGGATDRMIANVRQLSDAPLRGIVYSHGHVGYNAGVPQWLADAQARDDNPPVLIAHDNVKLRYDRYRATHDYQLLLNSYQFPKGKRKALEAALTFTDPTATFGDQIMITDLERPVEVFAAPSETDDAIGIWLPNQKVLYGGPAVISGFPNIGTPLRIQRHTSRWIKTLDNMIRLNAEILVPEFGDVVVGQEAVMHRLTTTADALRWIETEVIVRLNKGMIDTEIIHDLPDPGDLFDQPYLSPNYGSPDYVVRDICREHGGWWTSKNPTDLHPAAPDDAATAILGAIDPTAVVTAAKQHFDTGDYQLALHVVDLVAMAPGDEPVLQAARDLKADCCEKLARQTDPFVSRSLYFGSARLLRSGKRRWSEAPEGLDAMEAELGDTAR